MFCPSVRLDYAAGWGVFEMEISRSLLALAYLPVGADAQSIGKR
jgi:hypothetical protein